MKKIQLIYDLVSIASGLDLANLKSEADIVDGIIKKLAEWDQVYENEKAEDAAKAGNRRALDSSLKATALLKIINNNKKAQTQLNKILAYEGKMNVPVDGRPTPAQIALFKQYSGDYKSWDQLFKGLSNKVFNITMDATYQNKS